MIAAITEFNLGMFLDNAWWIFTGYLLGMLTGRIVVKMLKGVLDKA